MSYRNRCGGCKWFKRIGYPDGFKDRCVAFSSVRDTLMNCPKCTHYKPMGYEPENGLCYADFVAQCRLFYDRYLKAKGYIEPAFDDLTPTTLNSPAPFYHFELSKVNPRSDQQETVLMLDYCPTTTKSCMLYENFSDFNEIPPEYGDMHNPQMREQPPQFVYGYFSRLGDALNSMLKGCSIDLRKPIELYY